VSKHLNAYLDIGKPAGVAIAENTKVHKLLASIDCSMMVTTVAGIQAQDHLRNIFDESVNYLRAFILNSPTVTRNVSASYSKSMESVHSSSWVKKNKEKETNMEKGMTIKVCTGSTSQQNGGRWIKRNMIVLSLIVERARCPLLIQCMKWRT
jgi:hypothetical protein